MASASDITTVRRNTNEIGTDTYSDDDVGALIDDEGIAGASARIWEQKAARFSELVNTTEAGASHAFSDLHKNALAEAQYWAKREDAEEAVTSPTGRPRTSKIVRD